MKAEGVNQEFLDSLKSTIPHASSIKLNDKTKERREWEWLSGSFKGFLDQAIDQGRMGFIVNCTHEGLAFSDFLRDSLGYKCECYNEWDDDFDTPYYYYLYVWLGPDGFEPDQEHPERHVYNMVFRIDNDQYVFHNSEEEE